MAPETTAVSAALQQMIAYSGEGSNVTLTVDGTADTNDGDNRSRSFFDSWEEAGDEVDEEF